MKELNLFDARCTIGRHLKLAGGAPHTARDLLLDMDRHGIAEALVLDALAHEHHPRAGAQRVLRDTAAAPRLHPARAALPPGACEDQDSPERLLGAMRRNKVGAVFLLPRQYRFSLADWCVDALLDPLAAAGVPVVVNYNEIGPNPMSTDVTDWDELVRLCRRWPRLPVILSEWRIRRTNRLAYRALDACPNLYLELSGYWLHHGIEYLARRWGAERLIFGTQWPHRGQGSETATLVMADVSDEEKQLIGGDNLRRLLKWCEPEHPVVTLPEPEDDYVRLARTGSRAPGMTFLDNHGHLDTRCAHYHLPDAELEQVVAEMSRLGVEKTCVFGFTGVFSDEKPGNDYVADAVRRYPDRFVGFTLVNPLRGLEAMLGELERGHAMGLRGVKLIPHYQGASPEHPLIDVACEWAHLHRQIILNHHWGAPDQMERLLTTYPNACFFTGHATAAYADIMQEHANLFVCSCPLLGPRACEELVARIGANRLMFGSDLLDLPVAWGLGPVLFARLTPAEKRMILHDNLADVLQRYSLP